MVWGLTSRRYVLAVAFGARRRVMAQARASYYAVENTGGYPIYPKPHSTTEEWGKAHVGANKNEAWLTLDFSFPDSPATGPASSTIWT